MPPFSREGGVDFFITEPEVVSKEKLGENRI